MQCAIHAPVSSLKFTFPAGALCLNILPLIVARLKQLLGITALAFLTLHAVHNIILMLQSVGIHNIVSYLKHAHNRVKLT